MRIILFLSLLFFAITADAEKITVLLDWFPNPCHAPLFVAKQQGYFKAENLEVDLIGPADPTDPPKLVAAGKADIAITYEPQYREDVARGLPLEKIGDLINHPLTSLVVLKNGPIKTLKDLKGKRVGYCGSGFNTTLLAIMLKTVGLTLNDIELINVHYDLTQALLSKKIDAVTGMMRTVEPIQMELLGQPARVFYPEEHGVHSYSELIFVVQKNSIKDPRWANFMKAVKKGSDYLKKHPEASWLEFVKTYPEQNNEINHRSWMATLPYFK